MDLDHLLHHYFGATDPGDLDEAAFEAGRQRIAIDLGVEREPGRKFALWAVMYSLGISPAPSDTFKDERMRRAADDYARMMDRAERS